MAPIQTSHRQQKQRGLPNKLSLPHSITMPLFHSEDNPQQARRSENSVARVHHAHRSVTNTSCPPIYDQGA
jgi:hypothetical protein